MVKAEKTAELVIQDLHNNLCYMLIGDGWEFYPWESGKYSISALLQHCKHTKGVCAATSLNFHVQDYKGYLEEDFKLYCKDLYNDLSHKYNLQGSSIQFTNEGREGELAFEFSVYDPHGDEVLCEVTVDDKYIEGEGINRLEVFLAYTIKKLISKKIPDFGSILDVYFLWVYAKSTKGYLRNTLGRYLGELGITASSISGSDFVKNYNTNKSQICRRLDSEAGKYGYLSHIGSEHILDYVFNAVTEVERECFE